MNDAMNKSVIEGHESRRLKAYHDSRGYLTIAVGCNLEDPGAVEICRAAGVDYAKVRSGAAITKAQCDAIFARQYATVASEARTIFPEIDTWPGTAAAVVCDMLFQLGLTRFRGFERAIARFKARDWKGAGREIENSALAQQTPNRVRDNVALLNAVS